MQLHSSYITKSYKLNSKKMPNNKSYKINTTKCLRIMKKETITQVLVMVLKSFKKFFNDSTMI